MTPLTAAERETIARWSDADSRWIIDTTQRTVITALRRKPYAFIETGSDHHGATEWVTFTITADGFNLANGAKRRGTPRPHLRLSGGPSVMASGGAV